MVARMVLAQGNTLRVGDQGISVGKHTREMNKWVYVETTDQLYYEQVAFTTERLRLTIVIGPMKSPTERN